MVTCVGPYSARKFLKFEARKCHFLHSEHSAPKFMLTILVFVFEIKEGKNAQKVINHNLSLLIRWGYQWPKATCMGAYSPENF